MDDTSSEDRRRFAEQLALQESKLKLDLGAVTETGNDISPFLPPLKAYACDRLRMVAQREFPICRDLTQFEDTLKTGAAGIIEEILPDEGLLTAQAGLGSQGLVGGFEPGTGELWERTASSTPRSPFDKNALKAALESPKKLTEFPYRVLYGEDFDDEQYPKSPLRPEHQAAEACHGAWERNAPEALRWWLRQPSNQNARVREMLKQALQIEAISLRSKYSSVALSEAHPDDSTRDAPQPLEGNKRLPRMITSSVGKQKLTAYLARPDRTESVTDFAGRANVAERTIRSIRKKGAGARTSWEGIAGAMNITLDTLLGSEAGSGGQPAS